MTSSSTTAAESENESSDARVSGMEVLKFDVEGFQFLPQAEGYPQVDEVQESPSGVAVYVDCDGVVSHKSPPRKLNEKMLEHGYAFIDWAINGVTGDDRAIFEYTAVVEQ